MPLFSEFKVRGNQRHVALLVAVGLSLAAFPVYLHSKAPKERTDHYAATKKRNREQRLQWMHSPDMPTK